MIELRWRKQKLEYRIRMLRIDNWGDIRGFHDWSDWQNVPVIEENEKIKSEECP